MIPIGKKIKRQMSLGMSLMVRLMNSRTILSTLSLREKRLMNLKRVHPSHWWPCTRRDVLSLSTRMRNWNGWTGQGPNQQINTSSSISLLIAVDGPTLTNSRDLHETLDETSNHTNQPHQLNCQNLKEGISWNDQEFFSIRFMMGDFALLLSRVWIYMNSFLLIYICHWD